MFQFFFWYLRKKILFSKFHYARNRSISSLFNLGVRETLEKFGLYADNPKLNIQIKNEYVYAWLYYNFTCASLYTICNKDI
jgi:hypothetical protein